MTGKQIFDDQIYMEKTRNLFRLTIAHHYDVHYPRLIATWLMVKEKEEKIRLLNPLGSSRTLVYYLAVCYRQVPTCSIVPHTYTHTHSSTLLSSWYVSSFVQDVFRPWCVLVTGDDSLPIQARLVHRPLPVISYLSPQGTSSCLVPHHTSS